MIDFITPFTEQCSCLKRFTLVPGTNDRSSRASRALGNVVHNYVRISNEQPTLVPVYTIQDHDRRRLKFISQLGEETTVQLHRMVYFQKCQIQLSREMSKEGSKPSNAQRDETRHDDAGSKRRQREKEVLVSFHVPATLSCSLEPYGSSFTPIAVHRRAR